MNASHNNKRIKVTLTKSLIGTKKSHRATVKGLGLRRINSSAELEYSPAILGMLEKVNYLIKFEVFDAA
jgi:large subunit ribosomal protein L30